MTLRTSPRIPKSTPLDFETLFEHLRPKLSGFVARYLGNWSGDRLAHDVEDLLQESWVAGREQWSGFRGESKASTWLISIVRNKTVDFIRCRSWEAEFPSTLESDETVELLTREGSPEEMASLHEVQVACEEALEMLTPAQRRTFDVMLQGLPGAESAAAAGVKVETFRVQVCRLRKRRRELLAARIGEEILPAQVGAG